MEVACLACLVRWSCRIVVLGGFRYSSYSRRDVRGGLDVRPELGALRVEIRVNWCQLVPLRIDILEEFVYIPNPMSGWIPVEHDRRFDEGDI